MGDAHSFVSKESNDGAHYIEANGSLRLNGGVYYDGSNILPFRYGGMNNSVIRFLLSGGLFEHWEFESNVYGAVGVHPFEIDNSFKRADQTISVYRSSLLMNHISRESVGGGTGIDRLFVRYNGSRFSVSVGRMPINYSIASIFAINDFFAPFSASQIHTVYKPGVDAVVVSIQTGSLSQIEFVGVLGHEVSADFKQGNATIADSAALMYARALLVRVDVSLILGHLARKWVLGGAFDMPIGKVTLYGEGFVGIRHHQSSQEDTWKMNSQVDAFYGQVVGGLRLQSLYRQMVIALEYAFLSNGESDPTNYDVLQKRRVFLDEITYVAKHYGAMSVGMELHPLVMLHFMGLVNGIDFSGITSFSLSVSIGDNAQWVIGAQLPYGKNDLYQNSMPLPRSEFGLYPVTAFSELRYYF